MKFFLTFTLWLMLLLQPFNPVWAELQAPTTPLLIGVVEESVYKNRVTREEITVRPLFLKETEWIALDYPHRQNAYELKEVKWLITFDGRKLGNLTSFQNSDSYDEKYEWTYARDFHHRIKDVVNFPKLGNKENRFGSWGGIPQNRPVILVRNGGYEDPERWKRFKPESTYLEQLFPLLKDLIKKPYHCTGAPDWRAVPIENLTMADIDLYRSYKNLKGQYLISVGMSKKHLACDGPLSPEDKPIWFFLSGADIKLVGYELDLLDAADYDKDGTVEFIFWHGGYNEDGYVLFDDGFAKRINYFWNYH